MSFFKRFDNVFTISLFVIYFVHRNIQIQYITHAARGFLFIAKTLEASKVFINNQGATSTQAEPMPSDSKAGDNCSTQSFIVEFVCCLFLSEEA